jgi:chromosome condensin MukBEF MukE localization factor
MATYQVAGQRECVNGDIDKTFDHLCQQGLLHFYGDVIKKLERLSRELPMVVMMGTPNERMQIHERVQRVIAEIKAETGLH